MAKISDADRLALGKIELNVAQAFTDRTQGKDMSHDTRLNDAVAQLDAMQSRYATGSTVETDIDKMRRDVLDLSL